MTPAGISKCTAPIPGRYCRNITTSSVGVTATTLAQGGNSEMKYSGISRPPGSRR